MGLDELTVALMFNMARQMAQARGGSPKYIIREAPRTGAPLEVFEYMPTGGDVSRGEYTSTGKIVPREIIKEKNADYYLIISDDCQLVVYQT